MKPKILIVEDDHANASFIRRVLEDHEFESDHVRDADRALEYLARYAPALVILDVNLPGMTGTQFCELVRKQPKHADLPILMLTVLGGERERVKGLRAGADDYLAKPFSPQELIERIRAILRRVRRQEGVGNVVAAHGISVDVERHRVEAAGKLVELRPKEYDLLLTFLKKPGIVFSARAIAETIWSLDEAVTKHTVSEHIHNLRKKLGKLGALIETVPDAGYRLKDEDDPAKSRRKNK